MNELNISAAWKYGVTGDERFLTTRLGVISCLIAPLMGGLKKGFWSFLTFALNEFLCSLDCFSIDA